MSARDWITMSQRERDVLKVLSGVLEGERSRGRHERRPPSYS